MPAIHADPAVNSTKAPGLRSPKARKKVIPPAARPSSMPTTCPQVVNRHASAAPMTGARMNGTRKPASLIGMPPMSPAMSRNVIAPAIISRPWTSVRVWTATARPRQPVVGGGAAAAMVDPSGVHRWMAGPTAPGLPQSAGPRTLAERAWV